MKYVFLLNMGGVNNINECELFLKNMFADPNILTIKSTILRKIISFIIRKTRIKQMRENYSKIGGKSPLTDIQKSLCEKLNKMQHEFKFDFISTYVPPFAKDVLSKYDIKNDDEIILFPLYPHYSTTTTKSSLNDFYKNYFGSAKIKVIDAFFKDYDYNDIIFNAISKQPKADVLLVSAHSLPEKIIKNGDIYEQHIKEHFSIIQDKFKNNFKKIILAYQSKLGPVKWLEPSLSDVLNGLKNESVLIYPVSFCIDCSETVFELGIEYKNSYNGIYLLCECPNDSDNFCNFILRKVKEISR